MNNQSKPCCEKCSARKVQVSQLNPFGKTVYYCLNNECSCHREEKCRCDDGAITVKEHTPNCKYFLPPKEQGVKKNLTFKEAYDMCIQDLKNSNKEWQDYGKKELEKLYTSPSSTEEKSKCSGAPACVNSNDDGLECLRCGKLFVASTTETDTSKKAEKTNVSIPIPKEALSETDFGLRMLFEEMQSDVEGSHHLAGIYLTSIQEIIRKEKEASERKVVEVYERISKKLASDARHGAFEEAVGLVKNFKTDERKTTDFGEYTAETYNEKMLVNSVLDYILQTLKELQK